MLPEFQQIADELVEAGRLLYSLGMGLPPVAISPPGCPTTIY